MRRTLPWLLLLSACTGDFPDPPGALVTIDAAVPDAGCDPIIESCNGKDDDCDLLIDEGLQARPCPGAIGVCAGAASNCMGGDGWTVCDPPAQASLAGLPWAEQEGPPLCEGLDNDCDGTVDEDCECIGDAVRACGPDVEEGRCVIGEQACEGGLWGACVGAVEAVEESCNGADDDCDSKVDEDLLNACGACGPTPPEVCNDVDDDCDLSVDEGVQNACGACGEVPEEVCNGMDDDCDERVDEGVLNACLACGPVPEETCNGLDDDCDTRVDEGGPEVCNGVDDDCDGAVDELPPRRCDNCDVIPCRAGTLNCTAGVDRCEVNP